MELFYRKTGVGKPFVILHGLYGSSDNWVSISRALPAGYEVWLIDIRNHGRSPHSEDHSYQSIARDLFEFSVQHKLEKFILLGHSMGGKAAMYFVDKYSEFVSHLIIIDIAPKSYLFSLSLDSDTLNHKQIMEGMMTMSFEGIKNREEIEMKMNRHIKNDKIRHFLMKNIKRNQDMSFGWILNINALYLNIENILCDFKPSKNDAIDYLPVLFIKGSDSDYIDSDDIQEIKKRFSNVQFAEIPNAGHWLHIEQPELLVQSILNFLGDSKLD